MYIEISLLAYIIDWLIGEFKIKHPVEVMGNYINWFERNRYKDSVLQGMILTFSLTLLVFSVSFIITLLTSFLPEAAELMLLAVLASMGLAGRMLHDSVKEVLLASDAKAAIAMLVSRDTANMTNSDIYKACIETYSENLSDGLIAPMFYLCIFGLEGLAVYKAINTLDSMVGYKTEKYRRFGCFSARLDDVVNYIPARLTAVLIALLSFKLSSWRTLFKFGHKHDSPNAGYPISAMAGALNLALGGDTCYHGRIKSKPYFGDGRKEIEKNDVLAALRLRYRLDGFIIVLFLVVLIILKQIDFVC